jgi:hypothetical protein
MEIAPCSPFHFQTKTRRFLHIVFAAVVPTTAPVVAAVTSILASLHTVFAAVFTAVCSVLAALFATLLPIAILAAHRYADHTENHQKTQNYCSLKFHGSPLNFETWV